MVVGPEQLDELRLGDGPVPVEDEIGQHAPELQGAVDIIGEGSSVPLQRKTAQQRDRNADGLGGLGGFLHDRTSLLTVWITAAKELV